MINELTKKKAEFYNKCIENNWVDMSDETQSLKAKVLAKDMGLNYKKINALFIEGEKADLSIKKECEEKRKKQLAEEERQALPSELIVSFVNSENPASTDALEVYKRSDKSFYYVYNNNKTEGVPILSLKAQKWTESTYRGPELIYTSATVGGITTGGVDYIEGKEVIKEHQAIRSILEMTSETTTFNVKWVIVHSYAIEHFKTSKLFTQFESSQIKCFEKTAAEIEEGKKAVTQQLYYNQISMDRATDLFSYIDTHQGIDDQKGRKIINLVSALFAKEYPKSADESFEEVLSQITSGNSVNIEKGIKEYSSIKKDVKSQNHKRFTDAAIGLIKQYSKSSDEKNVTIVNQLIELTDDNSSVIKLCHEDIIELIENVIAKNTSHEISMALDLISHFMSDDPEMKRLYTEAKEKYDDVLQKEKEQAILLEEKKSKAHKKIGLFLFLLVAIIAIAAYVIIRISIPNGHIKKGNQYFAEGKYAEAVVEFEAADKTDLVIQAKYELAKDLINKEDYKEAETILQSLGNYSDTQTLLKECKNNVDYLDAKDYMTRGEYIKAYDLLYNLKDYKDSKQLLSNMGVVPISAKIKTSGHTTLRYTLEFKYGNDGSLITISKTDHDNNRSATWHFDSKGNVSKYDYATSETALSSYSYKYNSDGSIVYEAKYNGGLKNVKEIYNKYGILMRNDISIKLDEYHNPTGTIKTRIEELNCRNNYKSFYNTKILSHIDTINNLGLYNTQVDFEYSVMPRNGEYDIEKIWRNIRMICDFEIWSIW